MSDVPMKAVTITECKPVVTYVPDEEAFKDQPVFTDEELEAIRNGTYADMFVEDGFAAYTPELGLPGFVGGGGVVTPPSEVPIPGAGLLFAGVVLLVFLLIGVLKRV